MLRQAVGKVVGAIVVCGVIIGLMIWGGVFSKNDAITFSTNAGTSVGFGTGAAGLGMLNFFRGIGDAVKLGKADVNGFDAVPDPRANTNANRGHAPAKP